MPPLCHAFNTRKGIVAARGGLGGRLQCAVAEAILVLLVVAVVLAPNALA